MDPAVGGWGAALRAGCGGGACGVGAADVWAGRRVRGDAGGEAGELLGEAADARPEEAEEGLTRAVRGPGSLGSLGSLGGPGCLGDLDGDAPTEEFQDGDEALDRGCGRGCRHERK